MTAAVQLGRLGAKKGKFAEPALLTALGDSNQGVRDCSAWALNQFGSTSPALVKALVKQVEVETRQSLRWRWQGDFSMRVDPIEALTRIKPRAPRRQRRCSERGCRTPTRGSGWRAASLLRDAIQWSGGPSSRVSPLLLTTLRDKESSLRLMFVDDLVRLDGETRRIAVGILVQHLLKPQSSRCSRSHRRPFQIRPGCGTGRQDPHRSAPEG